MSFSHRLMSMRRSVHQYVLILVTAALVAGCGADNGLEGVWTDEQETVRYAFERDGQVMINALDSTVEAEYAIDGERLTVTGPQGTVVLKFRDGRLEGPMGLVLHPAPSLFNED